MIYNYSTVWTMNYQSLLHFFTLAERRVSLVCMWHLWCNGPGPRLT